MPCFLTSEVFNQLLVLGFLTGFAGNNKTIANSLTALSFKDKNKTPLNYNIYSIRMLKYNHTQCEND